MCSAPRATALVRLVIPFQKDELKELLIVGVAGCWVEGEDSAAAPVQSCFDYGAIGLTRVVDDA